MKTKPSTLKQELSKDMKKQGHVSKKKPSNKTLSSEKSLSEKPKKGTHREPNSKKLSSEVFLQKSHKLVHLKEFAEFSDEVKKEEVNLDIPVEDKEKVKVKNLIEYLQTLDSEAEVELDRDGWDHHETPLETIKRSYLFHYTDDPKGEKYLTINN